MNRELCRGFAHRKNKTVGVKKILQERKPEMSVACEQPSPDGQGHRNQLISLKKYMENKTGFSGAAEL